MADPQVEITPARPYGGTTLIEARLRGTFEPHNAAAIAAGMQPAFDALPDGGVLALDGSQLSFMGSNSIGLLVTWHLALQQRGARIVLVGFQPQVLDVLQTTGVTQILPHGPTLDDAFPPLSPPSA